jgi:hypothetical protein
MNIVFNNPLNFNDIQSLLGSILASLQGIIVVLSMIFLILGAIFYITSAGNDQRMKTAKGAITASMIGLAIGIAAPSFLKEIGVIIGWGPNVTPPAAVTAAPTLTEIALRVLDFLLGIVGTLAIIMMVVGGIMYLLSAGDEDRMKTGKKMFLYSVIGIAIALASLVIVRQVASLLKP